MALVMSQEGGFRLLSWMLSIANPIVPTLHLLGQPYTPHFTSTLSLYAANELASGIGYTPTPLGSPRASWTLSGVVDGVQAQYLTVSWTLTAAATIYGYYVSDDTDALSLWGELWPSAYVYGAGGGVFTMNPLVQLSNVLGVS